MDDDDNITVDCVVGGVVKGILWYLCKGGGWGV